MREFKTLYKFNLKRMLNTWMIRIMAVVLFGFSLFGITYIHGTGEIKKVALKSESDWINQEIIIDILNATGTGVEYEAYEENENYDGILRMEIEVDISEIMIKFKSDDSNYLTNIQLTAIQSKVQQMLYDSNNMEIPKVQVSGENQEDLNPAEEIAFYIIAFVLYLFILLCGSIITSSVALEKTLRVSELIIYRTSVLKLIYSKVLALYSILLVLILGLVLEFFIAIKIKWIDVPAIKQLLDSIGFTGGKIAIVVGIIIAGILVYTVLYIFVGTMIKSAEHIQFSQLPVAAIVLVGFMITVLCRQDEEALINKVCMYIPTFSPFLAVTRLFDCENYKVELLMMAFCTLVFLILGNVAIVKFYRKEND